MAASDETLGAMALAHLGIRETLTNIDTDQTAVAYALRTWYTPTRDLLLQAAPWSFATRFFDLVEQTGTGTVTISGGNLATFSTSQDDFLAVGDTITIGTTDYTIGARTSGTVWATSGANVTSQAFTIAKSVTENPTDDWSYAYRLPTAAWQVRRLVDGNRRPIASNRPVFRVGHDGTYRVLYTDYSDPVVVEYTAKVMDTTLFSPLFDEALAGFLAAKIAPLVTGGDPSNLGQRALALGQAFLQQAIAVDANEQVMDDEPMGDALAYRNGGGTLSYVPNRNSGR